MIESSQIKEMATILDVDPRLLNEVEDQGNFENLNEKLVFSNFLNMEKTEEMTNAKIALTLFLDEQSNRWGRSMIIPIVDFCKSCTGRGYQVLGREQHLVNVQCDACHGTGVKTVICKICQGNGKVSDGKTCYTCKGSGEYVLHRNSKRDYDIPCPRCGGHATIPKLQTGPEIYDYQTCDSCKGTSIGKGSFRNPVLDQEVLQVLSFTSGDFHWESFKAERDQLVRRYFG